MVRVLTQTVRGAGSSHAQSYILFTLSALVVCSKSYYYFIQIVCFISSWEFTSDLEIGDEHL